MSKMKRYLKYVKSTKNFWKSAEKGNDYERKTSNVYNQAIFRKGIPKDHCIQSDTPVVNNQRNENYVI